MKEHDLLVQKLKKEYGSIRKASHAMKVPYKTLHNLCQEVKPRIKVAREKWIDIKTFYSKDGVSQPLPSIKSGGHRYLTYTLEEAHALYKQHCLDNNKDLVGFSTFAKLRPKNVFKMGQTPDRQCLCEHCENFRLVRNRLIKLGVKGIPSHSSECIKLTLCHVDSDDCDNSDVFHQIDPSYGRIECITRSCKICGTDKLKLSLLEQNLGIDLRIMLWNGKGGS